ncbi:hypothetical protein BHE74_00024302 [Ensete ventricosum]|nr:hypothetical protein GW17_00010956 [Ensete ventricosum]RWW68188.1 hypothetical protein BHE74_00024302 [Ensete ventricosum]
MSRSRQPLTSCIWQLLYRNKLALAGGLKETNQSFYPPRPAKKEKQQKNTKEEARKGRWSRTSISMAVEDFYAVHSNYTTRVVLHVKDSEKEAIGAAAAGNQSIPLPQYVTFY